MDPIYSVIMTSYNYGAYIGSAIQSVIAQSLGEWELIIVDDCSSDDSWEVISKYTDPRIRAIRLESNKGACFAYNVGLALSQGVFIASLDSDDKFAPDKLDVQWRYLKANPDIDICGTWVKEINGFGAEPLNNDNVVESWFNRSIDLNDPGIWIWQNRLCHSSAVIRKSIHERIGSLRTDLRFTPDWDLWIRALAAGARFFVIQECLTLSRQHGKNITHMSPLGTIDEYADITSTSLNPYLIRKSRYDLMEKNLRGFLDHPIFNEENTVVKEQVLGKALGFREQGQGPDEISSSKLVIPVVSGLLERCRALEVRHDVVLADRDAAVADRDAAVADRDVAVAARDAAVADRDAVYRSTSWRITKPMRRFVSATRSATKAPSFLLLLVLNIFTWARLKRGLAFIKNGDVAALKSALVNVSRESAKQARQESVPELISPHQLSHGQPLVSVVIPCFNYGRFVAEAIDSILAQTLQNVEIIVVDGGSTDDATIQVLKEIRKPRTRILFREGRHLVGDNRNYGIGRAGGRYICCLDADDTLDPTYLEKAIFHLETYGYDIVSTAINFVGAKDGKVDILEYPDLTDMVSGNHVLTCAVFRRKFWESAGGYFDVGIGAHHVAEDWDFWLRVAARGARIRNISGEYLFNYRIHQNGSLSSAIDVKSLAEQKTAILDRNRELLTPEAFSFSTQMQAKYLRCDPSQTALAQSYDATLSASKKTLLLAMPYSLVGGAERLLSGLCAYLTANGWRIIVVTTLPQDPIFGNSIDWFKRSTSEVYALPNFLAQREWGDFINYLITSRRPDCLLNTGSRLIYELLPFLKENHKFLQVVDLLFNTVGHSESHIEFQEYISFALAENNEVRDWYLEVARWPASRVRTVSSGVDLKRFYPTVRPGKLIDEFQILDDEIVIGYSGRLSKEKAPDVFVEIAKLCRGIPNLRFMMTGAGPMAKSIAKEVDELPPTIKFEFAGLVDDVDQYLTLYDILVLPSHFDGRPLVVMEALACGVPVLASSVGGLPDLIEDGENGYLVPAANAELFADRIRSLAADRALLGRLKAGARRSAENRLDANQAYREYDIALRQTVGVNAASSE